MICVSLSHINQLRSALANGAELMELRFDLLKTEPASLFSEIPDSVRTIATCRPGWIEEEERIGLLVRAIELGADFVDLEMERTGERSAVILEKAKQRGCEVIISHHDYYVTPEKRDLEEILEGCYLNGADVAKIACMVNTPDDLHRLFALFSLPGRKVVLGMGPLGRISRVAAPYLGGEFTFAATDTGKETAPGQLTLEQLRTIHKIIGS